jgi:hypothetical protein
MTNRKAPPNFVVLASWPRLKSIFLAGSVLLTHGVAHLAWGIPKPLLMVSGAFFLICLAGIRLWDHYSWRIRSGQAARAAVAWAMMTPVVLGSIFYFDKGGWMWYLVSGYNVTLPEANADTSGMPVAAFTKSHQFFQIDAHDSTKLIVPKGVHRIDETIVVPKGFRLFIEPGAELHFKVGCSLISYSPIIARGSVSQPILFTAQNKWRKWGVVGVVSPGASIFENIVIEHGRQALVNGIEFTGTLSLVGSDVKIAYCRFVNLYGKDALNVRHGRVSIHHNLFQNTFKDGLDLDGGSGEVTDNRFIECGDESIDLSENGGLEVVDNEIIDFSGGRITAEKNLMDIKKRNTLRRAGNEARGAS